MGRTPTYEAQPCARILRFCLFCSFFFTFALPSLSAAINNASSSSILSLHLPTNATLAGRVSPEYVSYTMDWWSDKFEGWENASILTANLDDSSQLQTLAAALQPSFWRIGGSQADTIVYRTSSCKGFLPFHCLTLSRWDEILQFASKVGARIVFTLNYLGQTSNDGTAAYDVVDWNSSNAEILIAYTEQHALRHLVYAYELGNELSHGGKAKNQTRIRAAYQELKRLLVKYNSSALVAGPAETGGAGVEAALESRGDLIDIVTYHRYHGGGKDERLAELASSRRFYDHAFMYKERISVLSTLVPRNTPVWIGEGALAYNSGRRNVTDSLLSSLWFANLLGALSKTHPIPHSVYCRQALIGGHYELVDHTSMQPNPDYYVALLYKKLVSVQALGDLQSTGGHRTHSEEIGSLYQNPQITWGCCDGPGKDALLAHAFCSKASKKDGDVTLVMINVGDEAFEIALGFGDARSEFVMTAADNDKSPLEARRVFINGQLQQLFANGTLTDPLPRRVDNNVPMTIPPYSVSFIVVHGAQVENCIEKRESSSSDHEEDENRPTAIAINDSFLHVDEKTILNLSQPHALVVGCLVWTGLVFFLSHYFKSR